MKYKNLDLKFYKKSFVHFLFIYLFLILKITIFFFRLILSVSNGPLEDLRNAVNCLSGESLRLKEMMIFNKELLRLQKFQTQQREKTSYLRWSGASINTSDLDGLVGISGFILFSLLPFLPLSLFPPFLFYSSINSVQ
jgi:hypothetical protein